MPDRKCLWMAGLVMLICTPLLFAGAPPPPMNFHIIYEISPVPDIVSMTLLGCQSPECSTVMFIEEVECDNDYCNGYQLDDDIENYYLYILLSDNTVYTSNIFEKNYDYSWYQVTVMEDELLVIEEDGVNESLIPYNFVLIVTFFGYFLLQSLPILLFLIAFVIIIRVVDKWIEVRKMGRENNIPEEEVKE